MKIDFNIKYVGKISSFGGPDDSLVSPSEGLALIERYQDKPHLFLSEQPKGTTGLARRLNPESLYCACPWSYSTTPKPILRRSYVKIIFKDKFVFAECSDWGPHPDTGRIIDVSPEVMKRLGTKTDDIVECILTTQAACA